MSIIAGVQARVSKDRNRPPRGARPVSAKFAKPVRDLRTFVYTHQAVLGFYVVTDRGTFFSEGRRPGMVRVVTTHEDWPPMAWFRDDFRIRDDFVARLRSRITGNWPRGAWRRMTPISPVYDD